MKTLNPKDVRQVRRETLAENAEYQSKMILSAMCLALREQFGFGQTRCLRMLEAVERITTNALTSVELIDQCKDELNIDLREG